MKNSTIFALAVALAGAGSNALAQETPSAAPGDQAAMAPRTTAAPKVGDTVYDNTGTGIGTVAAVSGANFVLAADTGKATVPIASLGTGDKGLMINTTKAQIDAAIAAADKNRNGR